MHLRREPERPPAVPAPEIKDCKVFSEGKDTGVERFLRGIDVIIIGIVSPYNHPQRMAGVLTMESVQGIFRPGYIGPDYASPPPVYRPDLYSR